MAGETQSQLLKENQTLLAALKKVKDQIAQLEKRNKTQGQRPQQGERRFGDPPEAENIGPKPPDPSWRDPYTPIGQKRKVITSCAYTPDTLFSGLRRNPEVYLRWEMNMDKGCCPIKFPRKRGCHKLSKPVLGMPTNGG
ncbi:hypothetical protein DY000_02058515 [Brassica cretica]|uniref:Uncharacterized protein n=1 Tax=Brassica cretica TaxID=69181 RepID=A0ABQ7AZA3_BRACR|nr:hypothetical protein DY000_02058515 [Brassica cretica]